MQKVTIYTDGACHPNPGKGGWGAWLQFSGGTDDKICGGQDNTTNNQMEMMAAIMALKHLETSHHVTLYTDSKYLKDGITKWIKAWRKNGWRTASRKPVKNQQHWLELSNQIDRHSITWKWVKGHNGNLGNETADALATAGRRGEGPDIAPIELPVTLEQRVEALEKRIDEIVKYIDQLRNNA